MMVGIVVGARPRLGQLSNAVLESFGPTLSSVLSSPAAEFVFFCDESGQLCMPRGCGPALYPKIRDCVSAQAGLQVGHLANFVLGAHVESVRLVVSHFVPAFLPVR